MKKFFEETSLASRIQTATFGQKAMHTVHVANANLVLLFILVITGIEFESQLPLNAIVRFWIACLLLYPVAWARNRWDPFLWAKSVSLIPLATVWCTLAREDWIPRKYVAPVTAIILAENIGLAAARDIVSGYSSFHWTFLNGISGVILILTMIPKRERIFLEDSNYIWHLGWRWITAYTLWNWIFVFNNYRYSLGRHSAVLASPLIICQFFDEHGMACWLQNRTYTLAFYFVIRNSLYKPMRAHTDVSLPRWCSNYKTVRCLQVFAFTVNCLLLLYHDGHIKRSEMVDMQAASWIAGNSTVLLTAEL